MQKVSMHLKAIVAKRNLILVAFTRGTYIFTGPFSNLIRLVFIM